MSSFKEIQEKYIETTNIIDKYNAKSFILKVVKCYNLLKRVTKAFKLSIISMIICIIVLSYDLKVSLNMD